MSNALLEGRRILLVEDDYFIADALLEALEDAGATVLGPVSSVKDALALLGREHDVNGAVLDINLDGEAVFPVADVLCARGVLFLFATGYDEAAVLPAWRHITRCEKPVNVAAVVRALRAP
ncbi:response regulator (plasmid) [Paracoccus liaowanqingii]|uniref:Response regulator n=1 Tax=Paracoccus liaowanqingii TaxID=2560053 RepID=A0A4Y5SSN1_9RHOB|nr:response regulator [Paracoccus liaowanqingii]QDA36491.1 response regulator [Paracoccus liaowanqingii]